jgi:hypothetical protein
LYARFNTTNNTKDNKINIGERCWSVTAGKDKIYIGGDNKVIILNIDGSLVRKISTDPGRNYNLLPPFIMNSFVKSLLNVIFRGPSTPSCLLNTISRNVPSGDNLCMSSAPLM